MCRVRYGGGMCTLIVGRDVLGPGTVVLAANRDEDPARPSAPPALLADHPPVAGGRDLRAGGTWLAVRGGPAPAVAALLNRRPQPDAPPPTRSRGELPLALVTAEDTKAAAFSLIQSSGHGPCTLLWLTPSNCWALVLEPGRRQLHRIERGWHAITHADLDDPTEPRTAWLLEQLAGFAPRTSEEAWSRLAGLLVSHGDSAGPAVCLHEGLMQSVSASRVLLTESVVRYEHAEGSPCEHAFESYDHLLAGPAGGERGNP